VERGGYYYELQKNTWVFLFWRETKKIHSQRFSLSFWALITFEEGAVVNISMSQ
jgi:hypothetical protein